MRSENEMIDYDDNIQSHEQFVELLSWNTVHAIALTKSSKSGIELCVKYPSPRLTYTSLFQKSSQHIATKSEGLHKKFGVGR